MTTGGSGPTDLFVRRVMDDEAGGGWLGGWPPGGTMDAVGVDEVPAGGSVEAAPDDEGGGGVEAAPDDGGGVAAGGDEAAGEGEEAEGVGAAPPGTP